MQIKEIQNCSRHQTRHRPRSSQLQAAGAQKVLPQYTLGLPKSCETAWVVCSDKILPLSVAT